MDPFQVDIETRDEGTVARLAGNADNSRAEQLRQALEDILEQQTRRVVVDLTDLVFIASLVIGELITFRQSLRERGADLRLAGPTRYVEDVFRTTRLVELFPVFPSADEALTDSATD